MTNNNNTAFTAKASCVALIVCMAALGAPFLATAVFTCCEQIKPVMEACGCYVKKGGNTIPQDCCMQVIALRNLVRSSIHSQQLACRCLQDAAKNDPNINTTAYANIPSSCGVLLPYHFSVDMNCDNLV